MTQPGLGPTWGGHIYPWAEEEESKWTQGWGWLSHKNTWLLDHVDSRSWPRLWRPAFPSFPLQGLWLPVPEEVPFQPVPYLFPSPASSHLASPLPNPLTQGNGDLMTFTPMLETLFFFPKDFYKPSRETFQKPSNFCPFDCFHFVPHGRAGLVPSLRWQSDNCAPRLPLITSIYLNGIIIKCRSLGFQAKSINEMQQHGRCLAGKDGGKMLFVEGKCYLWREKAERMLGKESPSEGGRKAQMGYRGPHLQSPQSFELMRRMHSCTALVIDNKAQRLTFFVSWLRTLSHLTEAFKKSSKHLGVHALMETQHKTRHF